MGTKNVIRVLPTSANATKYGTGPVNDDNRQQLAVPLDFSASNGANIPFYVMDCAQFADTFGFIQGIKIDARQMHTPIFVMVESDKQQPSDSGLWLLPQPGQEYITIEPGTIRSFPVNAGQNKSICLYVNNSDPVAGIAGTYGSAMLYAANFPLPHITMPINPTTPLVPPSKNGIAIAAAGTQDIFTWTGPGPNPRVFRGATLVKPPGTIGATTAGVCKVIIRITVVTPLTGAQTFDLETLYAVIPAVADSINDAVTRDTIQYGANSGIILPKYTTKISAVTTLSEALTGGAYWLESFMTDPVNDTPVLY